MSIEAFKEITNHKLFSYKARMAMILLDCQEAYEELKEDASKSMLREGQPSAICERVFCELYDTKAWYIPDRLKFWDRRFGALFVRPFFTFDDDETVWSEILEFYCSHYIPSKEEYLNARAFNKAWEFYAQMLAVAKHNSHPRFEESYHILKERGLPDKVFAKKQDELEKFCLPDSRGEFGYFGRYFISR